MMSLVISYGENNILKAHLATWSAVGSLIYVSMDDANLVVSHRHVIISLAPVPPGRSPRPQKYSKTASKGPPFSNMYICIFDSWEVPFASLKFAQLRIDPLMSLETNGYQNMTNTQCSIILSSLCPEKSETWYVDITVIHIEVGVTLILICLSLFQQDN